MIVALLLAGANMALADWQQIAFNLRKQLFETSLRTGHGRTGEL
jgi:hypothetical protein